MITEIFKISSHQVWACRACKGARLHLMSYVAAINPAAEVL